MEHLNAYALRNQDRLKWRVRFYSVIQVGNKEPTHEERGGIKEAIWAWRAQNTARCSGYGFVIDIDETTAVIPESWDLPSTPNCNGYTITYLRTEDITLTNTKHRVAVEGILRESIKRHFKDNRSEVLGTLWQDYNSFCQTQGNALRAKDVIACRKFDVYVEYLAKIGWCLKFEVTTRTLDNSTFLDYYRQGEVQQLARKIELKQVNRSTYNNRPTAVRIYHEKNGIPRVLDLQDPTAIIGDAKLSPAQQQDLLTKRVRCIQYKKPPIDLPLSEVRLILDSQITQENHSNTIIDPHNRAKLYSDLRSHLSTMDSYGNKVQLEDKPVYLSNFRHYKVSPPALKVRSKRGTEIISSPSTITPDTLTERAKQRRNAVRKNGYLEQRQTIPLLVCPKSYGLDRAERLRSDLNTIIKEQGLTIKFGAPFLYNDVNEIRKVVEQQEFDTVFAVLPESSRQAYSDSDTHEKIKRQIPVPSQCIHHDNTLHRNYVNSSWDDIWKQDRKYNNRVKDRYNQCILNMLVKNNWVPFVPNDPFQYNLHIGIDVGGKHNTKAMACIAYGYANSESRLIFLPYEIPVQSQQVEPIPSPFLYEGLLNLLEQLYNELKAANRTPDFQKILFLRDGEFRGVHNIWNEAEALSRLYETLKERGWVDDKALWTAVEVSKRSENWRILRPVELMTRNPLIGQVVFPFEDDHKALVCTTGSPYLSGGAQDISQGTAEPLLLKIKDVQGIANVDSVIKDIVWEADICFTKLDQGGALPWSLHIADTGALQQSRAYITTGVTV